MEKQQSKKRKKLTKAQLKKWRKETNACEHDLVGYDALNKLSLGMFARSKQDASDMRKIVGVLDWQKDHINQLKKMNEMLVDKYEDAIEDLQRQLEEANKGRFDITRAYNGLAQLGKFAEEQGIDIKKACEDLPESKKNKYDWSHKAILKETGEVKQEMKLTPKKKDN